MWTAITYHAFFPVSTSHADPVKMPAINVETHQIAAQPESCSLSSRMSSAILNFCLFFIISLRYNVRSNNTNGREWQQTTGLQLWIPSTSKLCIFQIYMKRLCTFHYTTKYLFAYFLKINTFYNPAFRHNTVHTTRGMYTYIYLGVLYSQSQCLSLHTPLACVW
jgi:hypothetical protein